jgi:hypothetical protein
MLFVKYCPVMNRFTQSVSNPLAKTYEGMTLRQNLAYASYDHLGLKGWGRTD